MRTFIRFWTLLTFATLLLVFGCRKELGKPSWNVDGLAPILESKLTLQQLVKNELIEDDGPGTDLYLDFDRTIYRQTFDDLFELPDTTNTKIFQIPFGPINFGPGQELSKDTNLTYFDLSGVQLTESRLRTGKFNVKIFSNIKEALVLEYIIPNSNKNGQPFSVTKLIPAGSQGNPTELTDTFDLSGYNINLQGKGLNVYNTLFAVLTVTVDPNGSQVTINQSDYVSIQTQFLDAVPNFTKGYFNNRDVPIEKGYAETDVFDIIKNGSLVFGKPEVSMYIINQVGMDLRAKNIRFFSKNTETGTEIPLESNALSTINVTRALHRQGENPPYRESKVSLEIDNQNSNLPQFLANFPDSIGYQGTMEINPLGNISGNNDYVYFGTGISIGMDVRIPLSGSSIENVALADTVEYEFYRDPFYDNINKGHLKLLAKNHFPFAVQPQLYILNGSGNIIDSLVTKPVTFSGKVNENDIPDWQEAQIPIDQDKINTLADHTKILVKSTLNSDNNGENLVLKEATDFVEIKLTADVNYKMQIE